MRGRSGRCLARSVAACSRSTLVPGLPCPRPGRIRRSPGPVDGRSCAGPVHSTLHGEAPVRSPRDARTASPPASVQVVHASGSTNTPPTASDDDPALANRCTRCTRRGNRPRSPSDGWDRRSTVHGVLHSAARSGGRYRSSKRSMSTAFKRNAFRRNEVGKSRDGGVRPGGMRWRRETRRSGPEHRCRIRYGRQTTPRRFQSPPRADR